MTMIDRHLLKEKVIDKTDTLIGTMMNKPWGAVS